MPIQLNDFDRAIARYRQEAENALKMGAMEKTEGTYEGYLRLAEQWLLLAAEAEKIKDARERSDR
jgi:hypothetical protein